MVDEEGVTAELMKSKREGMRVLEKRREEERKGGREGKREEKGDGKLVVMANFRHSTGSNA